MIDLDFEKLSVYATYPPLKITLMSYFLFLKINFRWLLGGFLLTMFSSFGQTFYIALSTGHIRQTFGLTSGEYGSIYMFATLASAMVFPFVGQIIDRYSVGRVVVITTTMLGLACLMLAKAQSLWMLILSLFALRLFGQGMMTHIAITTMGRWYAENRGKAVSIASLGFNLGQAIFPLLFVIIAGYLGWRQGWLVASIVMVVFALPVIVLLLRVEREPHSKVQGLQFDAAQHWTRLEMLHDPLFWLTTMGVMAPPFISTAIFFHQDFLLSARGWSIDFFAGTFIWMTFVSISSGLISGIAVDRTSTIALLPFFLIPMGIACMVLALIDAPVAMILFMTFLGISFGMITLVFGSLWPEIYGTRHLGSIRSVITALMVLFSAIGPGVVGWMIDLNVSLKVQFLAMGFYCFTASIALTYCATKYKQRRARFRQSLA